MAARLHDHMWLAMPEITVIASPCQRQNGFEVDATIWQRTVGSGRAASQRSVSMTGGVGTDVGPVEPAVGVIANGLDVRVLAGRWPGRATPFFRAAEGEPACDRLGLVLGSLPTALACVLIAESLSTTSWVRTALCVGHAPISCSNLRGDASQPFAVCCSRGVMRVAAQY